VNNNNGGSQLHLIILLGKTVKELRDLLELYAPAWYTDEVREKTEAALQMLEKH
jgi:hypothetical protein